MADAARATWPVAVFLAGQAAIAVVWGARLDTRVAYNEQRLLELERRVSDLDEKGTRRLVVVEDRQVNVVHRLDDLARRLDALSSYLSPHQAPERRQP